MITGSYEVLVEDITENEILWTGTRDPLAGGASDSFSFQKQFTTIGVHTIRLTLDSTNNVTEMNDETDGTNNNVAELELNITAIGVRITPHMADGSMPADADEVELARKQVLDPSPGTEVSWDLTLNNEGTSDEEISRELIQIKGIGQWTVDMFLMFTLNRPDVMPYSDLGIRKGMKILFNLSKLPTKNEMETLSIKWKPYRTVASWYIWKVADDL